MSRVVCYDKEAFLERYFSESSGNLHDAMDRLQGALLVRKDYCRLPVANSNDRSLKDWLLKESDRDVADAKRNVERFRPIRNHNNR